jgi:hypothetical protein
MKKTVLNVYQCAYLGVELVVAQIQRSVDGLEGFKVNVNLLFLPFRGHNGSTIDHEAIVRDPGVKLEPLLCGGNGAQHRQPVHSALDVGGCAKLVTCGEILVICNPCVSMFVCYAYNILYTQKHSQTISLTYQAF